MTCRKSLDRSPTVSVQIDSKPIAGDGLDRLADALVLLYGGQTVLDALRTAQVINSRLSEKEVRRQNLESAIQRRREELAELERQQDSV